MPTKFSPQGNHENIKGLFQSFPRESLCIHSCVKGYFSLSPKGVQREKERSRQTDREGEKTYVRWSAITSVLSYERPPVSVHGSSCSGVVLGD